MRARRALRIAIALSTIVASGCDATPAPPKPTPSPRASASPATSSSSRSPAAPSPVSALPTRFPAASRVVALGDVHGDLAATRKALRLSGLIGDDDQWTGGSTVVVQTGDVLDRGDDEQAILDLLHRLQKEAASAGGTLHLLNGNHELMNAAGDFRYVTPGGFVDFQDAPGVDATRAARLPLPPPKRARAAALLPGGAYARQLATHPVAITVGETVFAHGGVLPKHVRYGLERMNREVAAWLLGGSSAGRSIVTASDSPVWSRHFSDEPDEADCALLARSLAALKVKRMVVGHTVQPTVRPACDEKVWRVDVGMSAHYGGQPEALEITADGVHVLR